MLRKILVKFAVASIILVAPTRPASAAGTIYLVLGSDTAIWDGMSVSRYHCYYNIDLYTDPVKNAFRVMDPAFRSQFIDSYGQPLKMTWWMMAGNIFRYANNRNIPLPNIMTMYLMKKYHGDTIVINGDELSLHYHTFHWSDYDQNGFYYWNQALTFAECLEDFEYTLAQLFLEEQIFPVSFRSGWHYMDNDWQYYLDARVLPYSMHNDYPSVRVDTTEPLGNTYDWSSAPAVFIPFRPSPDNYQLPGPGRGWNVRSAHFSRVIAQNIIETIFSEAAAGMDQVACFWGHLPETDFLDNIAKIDSALHDIAGAFPGVSFRYCTAVEAMQFWRDTPDHNPPGVSFEEVDYGERVGFVVRSDEPIFQEQPFVAVKDVYERYTAIPCLTTGANEWTTAETFLRKHLAKAGVALCDTLGNQSLRCIEYLPDDVFLDNTAEGYSELAGAWRTTSSAAWEEDARIAQVSSGDSAAVRWDYVSERTVLSNIFIQVPEVADPAERILFTFYKNGQPVDTVRFYSPLVAYEWLYLSTQFLDSLETLTVNMSVSGHGQEGKWLAADVLKISALVRERQMVIDAARVDFGPVSLGDTVRYDLTLRNAGIEALSVSNIFAQHQSLVFEKQMPFSIEGMHETVVPLRYVPETIGYLLDTLIVESDDPLRPRYCLPVVADVQNYFEIVDNEDSADYREFGEWFTSVAQAYGSSSRCVYFKSSPGAHATFSVNLDRTGLYELCEIVPKTENATENARYTVQVADIIIDSVYIDQNVGSGNWLSLGRYFLPAHVPIQVTVSEGGSSSSGIVLRADAIRFSLLEELTEVALRDAGTIPADYALFQNYPNPFSSGGGMVFGGYLGTTIRYRIPRVSFVEIAVYNVLGERIATLEKRQKSPGYHAVMWDGRDSAGNLTASGVYFYSLRAGEFAATKKLMHLR